jgi:hypothetical protein
MEKELNKFLNEVNVILQQEKIKKEESLKRGERFNMFETLGVAHYEVTHSSILASFLNPKELHGQGDMFLKLFFSTIGDETGLDTANSNVYTEFSNEEGRIDILIEDNNNKAVIIENKIYAGDQDAQLIRYNRFANNKYKKGFSIYYLTLAGDEASEKSAKTVQYKCISYAQDIINWLEQCIKESATTPMIRETLVQYKNHIKQLTNQDMEAINKEKLMEVMVANSEAVAAICNTQNEYKQYVYLTIVKPKFEEYCQKNHLLFEDSNLFEGSGERGFFFRKEEWKSAAIWFYTERAGEKDFYWGVSNYEGDALKVEKIQLDCISGPITDYWPYGYKYLSQYRNWDMNTLSEMVNGNYVKYITDLVNKALEEIDRKNLPMP